MQQIIVPKSISSQTNLIKHRKPTPTKTLKQGGFYDLVLQLSQQAALLDERDLRATNKDTIFNFYRDVALATALAHCGLAHQALKKGHIALGCGRLEEALQIIKEAGEGDVLKGIPAVPLAVDLPQRIEAALMDFKAEAILNYLKGPLSQSNGASLRPQAVAALSVMLSKPETAVRSDGSQPITPEYASQALESLSSDEICSLLNWDTVSKNKSHYSWYFAGVLPLASLAHIVSGFIHRRPALLTQAQKLLEHASSERDVAVHHAVCALLLGDAQQAINILVEDDRMGRLLRGERVGAAGSSSAVASSSNETAIASSSSSTRPSSPSAVRRATLSRGPIAFPSRDGILEFIQLYSPEDMHDLTPGLCVFVEGWLARLAFPRFRNTKEHPPSSSLAAYLDDPKVMAGLATHAATDAALKKLRLPGFKYVLVGVAALIAFTLFGGGGGRGRSSSVNSSSVRSSVQPAEAVVGGTLSTLPVPAELELTKDVVRHLVEEWLVRLSLVKFHFSNVCILFIVSSCTATSFFSDVVLTYPFSIYQCTIYKQCKLQKIKAEAMGPRHKTQQLSQVLAEPMLSAVKQESEDAAESGWFWNIHPIKVRIERIDTNTNGNGGKSGKNGVTALAVVEEGADLWASNGRKGDSYKTTYKVEYNLVKAGKAWKIASALVLGR